MRSYRVAGWRGEEIGWSGARLFAPVSPPSHHEAEGRVGTARAEWMGSTLFLDT